METKTTKIKIYDVTKTNVKQVTVGNCEQSVNRISFGDYSLAKTFAKDWMLECIMKDPIALKAIELIDSIPEPYLNSVAHIIKDEDYLHVWFDDRPDEIKIEIEQSSLIVRDIDEDFEDREILLVDKEIFGDDDEHKYDCKCYDGYAVCNRLVENESEPKRLFLCYPVMNMVKKAGLKNSICRYCGYEKDEKINYGDVALSLGEIYMG